MIVSGLSHTYTFTWYVAGNTDVPDTNVATTPGHDDDGKSVYDVHVVKVTNEDVCITTTKAGATSVVEPEGEMAPVCK